MPWVIFPYSQPFTGEMSELGFSMKSFTNKKIAVLLVAIAMGAWNQMAFSGPAARGATGGATVSGSGAAAGEGINTTTGLSTTGTVGAQGTVNGTTSAGAGVN